MRIWILFVSLPFLALFTGCATSGGGGGSLGGGWYTYEMPLEGQHAVMLPVAPRKMIQKPVHEAFTPFGFGSALPGAVPGQAAPYVASGPGGLSASQRPMATSQANRDDGDSLLGGTTGRNTQSLGLVPGVIIQPLNYTNNVNGLSNQYQYASNTNLFLGPQVVDIVHTAILRGTLRNYQRNRRDITRVTVQGSGYEPESPKAQQMTDYIEVRVENSLEAYAVERHLVLGSLERPLQIHLTTYLARSANIDANKGMGYIYEDNRSFIEILRGTILNLGEGQGRIQFDEAAYLNLVDPVLPTGSPDRIKALSARVAR